MAKKLQHFSHECVLTSPKTVSHGICSICHKDEPVELACRPCNFDLCEGCSNLPQEVAHDFHPGHTLEFCLHQYDQKPGYIVCSGCGNMSAGSFYKCKECEIYLDLCCALQPNIVTGWDVREMLHYSHCHMLRRSRPGPDASGLCLLCELPLSPSAICYGCVHCYSFFHEQCLDLPTEIQHPVHPAHPLVRLDYIRICGDGRQCDACGNYISGVPFGCLECDVDFHFRCLDSLLRALMHKSHQHTLFYVPRKARNVYERIKPCQICMGVIYCSIQSYYRCMECEVVFHFSCLGIPNSLVKRSCHIHPLVCKIFIAEEDSLEYCGVCETKMHPGHHAYSCEECGLLGHIECILCKETPSPLYVKDLYSTVKGTKKKPTNREDCETNSFENKLMGQLHTNQDMRERKFERTPSFGPIIFPQLYQVSDIGHVHVMRPVDMSELDEYAECNMCEKDILSSPYRCGTCDNFETHHFCAKLAHQTKHRFHRKHCLTLLPNSPAWCMMNCDICRKDIKGFNLFCRTCNFIIDIRCALKGRHSVGVLGQKVIRTRIAIGRNTVEVIISKLYPTTCAICDEKVCGKALLCMKREETYHLQCVIGKEENLYFHPLHLDHCLEFTHKSGSKCIACKLSIRKYCYQCFYCQVNFHVGCIEEANVSQNIWSHRHILYNFWMDDSGMNQVCSVCGIPCPASFYGCISCNFSAHVECLGFPSNMKNQHHQHTVAEHEVVVGRNCSLCGLYCSGRNYSCNHCKEVFHNKCIMSMNDREAATEEEQLGDIYLMYIERDLFDLLEDNES